MRFLVATVALVSFASASTGQVTIEKPVPGPSSPTTAPAKALTVCEGLARDWKSAEIELAENWTTEIGDNSAPRATMRAVRDQNSLLKAQIALQLMRDNKCSLPKRAPSGLTYSLDAMKCQTEKMKGNYKAPECDTTAWKALGQ